MVLGLNRSVEAPKYLSEGLLARHTKNSSIRTPHTQTEGNFDAETLHPAHPICLPLSHLPFLPLSAHHPHARSWHPSRLVPLSTAQSCFKLVAVTRQGASCFLRIQAVSPFLGSVLDSGWPFQSVGSNIEGPTCQWFGSLPLLLPPPLSWWGLATAHTFRGRWKRLECHKPNPQALLSPLLFVPSSPYTLCSGQSHQGNAKPAPAQQEVWGRFSGYQAAQPRVGNLLLLSPPFCFFFSSFTSPRRCIAWLGRPGKARSIGPSPLISQSRIPPFREQ